MELINLIGLIGSKKNLPFYLKYIKIVEISK